MERSLGEFHLIRIHSTGKYSELICYNGRLVRRASWDGVLHLPLLRGAGLRHRASRLLGFRWVGWWFDQDVVLTPKSPVVSGGNGPIVASQEVQHQHPVGPQTVGDMIW